MDILRGISSYRCWICKWHVLMARTQSTLHQLLHLLQHLASQRGLYMNPNKCELLRLNSNLPICLSHSTSPASCCSCCFCCDFTTLTPTKNSLADPLPVVDTAKYLGAKIPANSSSNADVAYRYSQAATAFRCLFLFSRTLRFIQKGSSRFMPKSLWQSCYMVPNHKSIHQPSSQNWTPFTTRSYAKFSKSKVHIIIGFWTSLALIAPTTSCCNRLLPKSQVSCSPVS